MTDLGYRQAFLALADLRESAEVGARRKHERLAGYRDGRNVGAGQRRVQRRIERGQATRSERCRAGVIMTVVQGDQDCFLTGMGEFYLPAKCPGDDFRVRELSRLVEQLLQFCRIHAAAAAAKEGFSQITEPPMPSPMHIVVNP